MENQVPGRFDKPRTAIYSQNKTGEHIGEQLPFVPYPSGQPILSRPDEAGIVYTIGGSWRRWNSFQAMAGLAGVNTASLLRRRLSPSAADLLDRDAGLGLPQKANDLFFGKFALLHVRHSPG